MHALDAWRERFGTEENHAYNLPAQYATLAIPLAKAIPFGGQRGDAMLLVSGDIVFAIGNMKPAGHRPVLTCLTKHQAIVNMQMRGVRYREPLPDSVAPSLTKAEKKARKKQIAAENGEVQDANGEAGDRLRRHADMLSKDRDALKRSLVHFIEDDALVVKIIEFAQVLRDKDRSTWPPKRVIAGFTVNPQPEQST